MPLYSFSCTNCDNTFSKITTKTSSLCPLCLSSCDKDAPEPSLLETPSNAPRKLSRQMAEKSRQVKLRKGIH